MLMSSNVHQREYPVPVTRLGEVLDTVAGEHDQIWPHHWPAIRFDGPLAVGARGGHGPIGYTVSDYRPGYRVEFRFEPKLGMRGSHVFEVVPGTDPGHGMLRHSLVARPTVAAWLRWLAIRPLHDALLEDLLDRVGREVGAPPVRAARWSVLVRLLRTRLRR
jgi:hypothetical protein